MPRWRGVPRQPALFVTPLAIDFSTGKTTATFRITNTGGGTLSWTASEDLPWLSLTKESTSADKQGNTISGDTTTGTQVITLTANRSALGPGISQGAVLVTSNGGDQQVSVSISQPAIPMLQVSPESVDFGTDLSIATLTIGNGGLANLEWAVSVPASASWLGASPRSGAVADFQGSDTVILTASRDGLAAGDYATTVTVTSNDTDIEVPVTLSVLPLSVSPAQITLGTLRQPANSLVGIANNGDTPINYTATANDAYLAVSTNGGTLGANTSTNITVTVDPSGLAPGAYTGSVTVASEGGAFTTTVTISFSISGFSISTNLVNFGQIEEATGGSFDLGNSGGTTVDFTITLPAAAAQWLSVSPRSGSVNDVQTISLTADPTRVSPAAYTADLRIEHEGLVDLVTVSMFSVEPPTLVVVPTFVDFDTTFIERQLTLWNSGSDTVEWRIDTAAFPAWLSLSPVSGGVASGTVAGDQNAILVLTADRSAVPGDETDFDFSFTVEAISGGAESVEVDVHLAIQQIPELVLEADGEDSGGRPYANFPVDITENNIRITNTGNGPLFWSISGFESLNYILSISPSQGTLEPGAEARPVITVSRDKLTYVGAQAELLLTTNDPLNEEVIFLVEIQVSKRVSVVGRPGTLAFGSTTSSDFVEIANGGDPDEILDFRITTTKEWLSVFPESGSSVGTPSDLKDWQTISVSVDRSLFEEESAAAQIEVVAYTFEDGEQVPLEGVDPLIIPVSVEVPSLSIETARPRLRVPSLVRTVMLLRNLRSQPIELPTQLLDGVADNFSIVENNVVAEITESSKFIVGPERIRGNMLILLDYSGSMQASASEAIEPEIANAPDPLQALYDSCIPQLIESLPSQYRIALAVMNERPAPSSGVGALRKIFPSDGEPYFTDKRTVLLDRFNSIDVVDNGATVLLPALEEGIGLLVREDAEMGLIPFDDADVKGLICVTDGRLTTNNQITLTDIALELQGAIVRFFPIGWGSQVFADPLVRLSVPSGGHYYATRTQPTGEVDNFGNLIRVPVAATLQDWCIDDSDAEPCDQSLGRDMAAQVIMSYVTLRDETSVNLEGRLSFNDPTDQNSPCIEEQGDISGGFIKTQLDYSIYSGDPRLGQLSLRSDGVQSDGTADVILRLEYMPRNVSEITLEFDINLGGPFTVALLPVPNTRGGAIPDWTVSPATVVGQNPFTVTLRSPDGTALRYADFGDLITMRFTGIGGPFSFTTTVLDPVYAADSPDGKFFAVPTVFIVGTEPTFAPAFPQPVLAPAPAFVEEDDGSRSVDLGSTEANLTIDIYNGGGVLPDADLILEWTLEGDFSPGTAFTFTPETGEAFDITAPSTTVITPNRSLLPGTYNGTFQFTYTIPVNSGLFFISPPIQVTYTVDDPVGAVSANTLNFAPGDTGLDLSVTNVGQSTLDWGIATEQFPPWLSATLDGGTLGPSKTNNFQIRVDRSLLSPGTYTYNIPVEFSTGMTETVVVTMTVL